MIFLKKKIEKDFAIVLFVSLLSLQSAFAQNSISPEISDNLGLRLEQDEEGLITEIYFNEAPPLSIRDEVIGLQAALESDAGVDQVTKTRQALEKKVLGHLTRHLPRSKWNRIVNGISVFLGTTIFTPGIVTAVIIEQYIDGLTPWMIGFVVGLAIVEAGRALSEKNFSVSKQIKSSVRNACRSVLEDLHHNLPKNP